MITRIEIDGFKSFENFCVDFTPFSVIVGPNASGKSNLFDAIQLISNLSEKDVRTALIGLRGEPEELFRTDPHKNSRQISLAVELLLPSTGVDLFGVQYEVKARRLRYELVLQMRTSKSGIVDGIFVTHEQCLRIKKSDDRAVFRSEFPKSLSYGGNISDFLTTDQDENGFPVFRVRQDGPNKSGKPRKIPAKEASQTALSTISSAEFPHLFAVKSFLSRISFLEINAKSARRENDRLEQKSMLPDASNLSAVLARIRDDSTTEDQPEGALIEVSHGLTRLIPTVKRVKSVTSADRKEYSFVVEMNNGDTFSSRVISDGTLRLLALVTYLTDPQRSGLLCFEEPENGVHEGRMAALVDTLREATALQTEQNFQIIVNTHSPAFMKNLKNAEIIAADTVQLVRDKKVSKKTRMRREPSDQESLFSPEHYLTRFEIEKLLTVGGGAA